MLEFDPDDLLLIWQQYGSHIVAILAVLAIAAVVTIVPVFLKGMKKHTKKILTCNLASYNL